MGFTREELESFRDATVADLVGDDPTLVFVGINPGLWTAATRTHFAHPGNRFYPALYRAGIIEREIDRTTGFTDADRAHLIDRGLAITNVVERATARASELSRSELVDGGDRLRERIERWRPAVVAIAGVTAYREAFGRPKAEMGRQAEEWSGASLWVVPNPSGLNAHETIESLSEWYARPAIEAGVIGV